MKVLVALLCSLLAAYGQAPIVVKRVVAMEYPPIAHNAAFQGIVEIAATITRDGKADNISAISGASILSGPAKDMLAKRGFEGCSAGDCNTTFVFSFVLRGTCDIRTQCPTDFEVDLPGTITVRANFYTGPPM